MVKAKSKGKRSASVIVDYAPCGAQSHMQKAPRGASAATVQWRQTMDDFITTFVGLDVHKDSIAMAVAETGRDEPRFLGTVSPEGNALHKALAKLGKPAGLMVVYEAGPSGYGLWRDLQARGYRIEVIAPSKIARAPSDRVKTDRRDALMLARLARAGSLVSVSVPDERDEALRDLSRSRSDAVRARLKARQQLKALLLRHGHRYGGKSSWTLAHERYLATVQFSHPAQHIAFTEYRSAVREAHERVERHNDSLRAELEGWRMRPVVEALMSLRGVDTVAAITLVTELGDIRRFTHPRELMSFLGLVPSEHSSGQSRRLGSITKCGNGHARRILVEAAWNYRFPARIGPDLQARQEKQPKSVRDIAWRAQLRLCKRYHRLLARQLQKNKVCVAIARELTGFVWDIARQVEPIT